MIMNFENNNTNTINYLINILYIPNVMSINFFLYWKKKDKYM